jgi:DNA-binding beta-propeller fold protein YncE
MQTCKAHGVISGKMIRGIMLLVMLVSVLPMFGCESSGDSANPGPADLENRAFLFTNGAAFGLTGQAVTLTFGDFDNDADVDPNTGPVTLQVPATGGRATGTGTVGSLDVTFSESTDIPEIPPGTNFSSDLRVFVDGSISLTNTATGVSSSSDPPDLLPTTDVAFVITANIPTGSYSVVDLVSRTAFNDIILGGVNSDAIARFFNGLVYVVNRFGADNIQVIDPQQGYTTIVQQSVGNGTNPQDIAVVSPSKAYVSRLGSAELLIVDPMTLAQLDAIDLSGRTKPNDLDGVPELSLMLVHNGLVYLILQHLDFTAGIPTKAAPGEIVVIDPATDTVVTVIELQGNNPFTDLQFSPDLNRILVGSLGDFLVNDGGIEAIDPDTNTRDAGFVIDETTIGGDITHFRIVSATKGFAVVVTDTNFANALVTFNPSTGQKLATVFGPLNVFMSHFAINSRDELYLAVTDSATPTPGVRIFDTVQDMELTTEPLSVGQLPPLYVVFVEE